MLPFYFILLYQGLAGGLIEDQALYQNSAGVIFTVVSENKIMLSCPMGVCRGMNRVTGMVQNTGTANGGPYPVTGVKVNGQVGGTLILYGGSVGQGTYTKGPNGQFTMDIGNMAPHQIVPFDVTVMGDGPMDNVQVQLKQNEFNPGTQQNASCTIGYTPCADIQVTKRVEKDTVKLAESFDFIVTIKNLGPDEAVNVRMDDQIHFAFDVLGVTPNTLCTVDGDQIVDCNLGTIAPMDSVVVRIKVQGSVLGKRTNMANGHTSSIDANLHNNKDSTMVLVIDTVADVAVMKMSNVDKVKVGDPVTFTITVKNNGPQPAHGVKLEDDLPRVTAVVGGGLDPNFHVDAMPKGCTLNNHTVTCEIGTMAPGEQREYVITGFPTLKRNIINAAHVSSTGPADPVFENNGAVSKVHVIGDQSSSGGNPDQGVTGDPISTYNGEHYFNEENDLFLNGPLSIHFDRYYASFLHDENIGPGTLGYRWSHNFDWRLFRDGNIVEIYNYKGKSFGFELTGGIWRCVTDKLNFQLREDGQGYLFADVQNHAVCQFDQSGKLVRIENLNGTGLDLIYQNNRLHTISDGNGRTLTCTYNGMGLLFQITDGTRSVEYSYEDSLLISYKNVLGNTVRYQYDQNHPKKGLMTARLLPGTQVSNYTQKYNELGQVKEQRDAYDHLYQIKYEGNMTTETDPLGNSAIHQHLPSGELVSYSDPQGFGFVAVFDAAGRRIKVTGSSGESTHFTYDPLSGLPAGMKDDVWDINVHYKEITYRGLTFYKPDSVYNHGVLQIIYEYDASGNLIASTNGAGDRVEYEYNVAGLLVRENVASGASGQRDFSHNDHGLLASVTDGAGLVTQFAYDNLFRLTNINLPDGSNRSFSYDAMDRMTTYTDESGESFSFTYDANNIQTSILHSSGAALHYAYDEMQRLVTMTGLKGDAIRFEYDAGGNVAAITDMEGQTMTLEYDSKNQLVGFTKGGLSHGFGYNHVGLLNKIVLPGNRRIDYTVNGDGLIRQVSMASYPVIALNYNEEGNVTDVVFPSGKGYQFGYDEKGWLNSISIPENIKVLIETNAFGKSVGITDPNGGVWQEVLDEEQRVTRVLNPLGESRQLSYDNKGRLIRVDGQEVLLEIEHTPIGHPSRFVYSDGTDINFEYDDLGRLVSTNNLDLQFDPAGDIISCNGLTMTWDAEGRMLSTDYGDGFVVNYKYDEAGRLHEIADSRDNLVRITNTPGGFPERYDLSNDTYTTVLRDDQDRIARITYVGADTIGAHHLSYDADGQIILAQRALPVVPEIRTETRTRGYNAAHRIEGFEYDEVGNVTSGHSGSYLWSLASTLREWNAGDGPMQAEYDGLGNRVWRSDQEGVTSYTWNYGLLLAQPVIEKLDGQTRWYHVFTPAGRLLYSIDVIHNGTLFYHFDERGNTSVVTDQDGKVVAAFAYTPYGLKSVVGDPEGITFTFAGRYGTIDEGSGLYLMHRRYYDANAQRFLSMDNDDERYDPRDVNPYVYALQNPMGYADPTGNNPEPAQNDGVGLDAGNVVQLGTFIFEGVATGFEVGPSLPGLPSGFIDFLTGSPGAPKAFSIAGNYIETGQDLAKTGLQAAKQGFSKYLGLYAREAMEQFNTASKWRTGAKVANGIGTVLNIYSVGKVLVGANENMDQAVDRFVDNLDAAVDAETLQLNELIRLLKLGRISRIQFQHRWRQIQGQRIDSFNNSVVNFKLNLGFEFVDGVLKGLETFLPNPTDASLSNGVNILTGSDTSIFRQ